MTKNATQNARPSFTCQEGLGTRLHVGCSGIGRRELTRDVEQDCEEEEVMKVEGNIQRVWEGIVPLAPRPHHRQSCKIEHHLTLGKKGQRRLKVKV